MAFNETAKETLHEYFFKKLSDLEDMETDLIRAMRTKRGLIILCDQLREVHAEKIATEAIYKDLRNFI